MSGRIYSRLPCHIVEDHNDALRPILRAVATKHLPFEGNLLVHFDSHPDLGIPQDLRSHEVFNKEVLFERLSIENWIMPAVFAGHFSTIIWIKPPWSNQIEDGEYRFYIGIEKCSGAIKVTSDLLYYVSEMLHCAEEDLDEKKSVLLYVITIGDSRMVNEAMPRRLDKHSDNQIIDNCISISGDQRTDSKLQTLAHIHDRVGHLIELHKNTYVLDVDLDFFTTMNPFLDSHKNVNMYDRLKNIYKFDLDTSNGQTIEDNQLRRTKQIKPLASFFEALDKISDHGSIQKKLAVLLENILYTEDRESLRSLVTDMITQEQKLDIDWLLVHDAGLTYDSSTQILPHHPSTDDEIRTLMHDATSFLDKFVSPTLVTVARSSLDDYCPPDKVDFVQDLLCGYFRSKHEHIECLKHY